VERASVVSKTAGGNNAIAGRVRAGIPPPSHLDSAMRKEPLDPIRDRSIKPKRTSGRDPGCIVPLYRACSHSSKAAT